jgi:hypothetical protein
MITMSLSFAEYTNIIEEPTHWLARRVSVEPGGVIALAEEQCTLVAVVSSVK